MHEAILRYVTILGSCTDGAMLRTTDGLLCISSDLPIGNGNQVLIADDGATPDALEGAVAWMRAWGRPFKVTLRAGTDERFERVLAQLGFSGHAWAPGMALHPIPGASTAPDAAADLTIAPVTDAAELPDYVRAMAPAYGLSEADTARIVSPALLANPEVSLLLGRASGIPVTTGMAIRTGRVAGVYFIGTVPEARGRGHGAAVTARIGADAATAGCDTATLQSSTMGLGVYERLGYRTVMTYNAWKRTAG